jgi:hypothetical protein
MFNYLEKRDLFLLISKKFNHSLHKLKFNLKTLKLRKIISNLIIKKVILRIIIYFYSIQFYLKIFLPNDGVMYALVIFSIEKQRLYDIIELGCISH